MSAHRTNSHSRAKPKARRLKKRMLQKKLKASWSPKRDSPLVRALEGGARQTRAALIPIRANRMPQTMGKTMAGGERGGWTMSVL